MVVNCLYKMGNNERSDVLAWTVTRQKQLRERGKRKSNSSQSTVVLCCNLRYYEELLQLMIPSHARILFFFPIVLADTSLSSFMTLNYPESPLKGMNEN